jgi:hypothetical protein
MEAGVSGVTAEALVEPCHFLLEMRSADLVDLMFLLPVYKMMYALMVNTIHLQTWHMRFAPMYDRGTLRGPHEVCFEN